MPDLIKMPHEFKHEFIAWVQVIIKQKIDGLPSFECSSGKYF